MISGSGFAPFADEISDDQCQNEQYDQLHGTPPLCMSE